MSESLRKEIVIRMPQFVKVSIITHDKELIQLSVLDTIHICTYILCYCSTHLLAELGVTPTFRANVKSRTPTTASWSSNLHNCHNYFFRGGGGDSGASCFRYISYCWRVMVKIGVMPSFVYRGFLYSCLDSIILWRKTAFHC